ncbi:MAG: UDP-4-amino-4,6-dideoxy-N-acetyl-beta-L-altrosamine transaminase [Hyphomicrobium sp.]|jgi:UDP-4-amino-4,6-dideoxy-N-acetyl-beta-L-altrosamine transaminase|uniref:UDP-4-amino-4, 6-dideoxy-N-acetyl-beta-L-altrosamine transaminase n=1 Tax=Hyphomicrobium sp. TaxID=82 RepID=UPI0025B8B55F|nr:UDP-4-amino-4,6-dideoxy-N-acetyl-beta-L-altrosamine transaminase [Hyphomicrobium sp.]MBX9863967.1 UDP-4-amino-4,6-dideoxy-N-acetyl-beta-L-altrosamine transaminase [Hyphomicrobium sp.]
MIPYGRQSISEDDIEAVVAVLRSDWLTQGPAVPRFERAVADYTGAKHALAMSSATGALHVACLALGAGLGRRVWTSPISFVASSNCARYCGADVDFVDVDARTSNMCASALAAKLESAAASGALPHIVIPVHLAGQSCDMEAIHALSQRFGFRIIEDASHAIGGRYKGTPVGSGHFSDVTIFSFHPVKVITTGEGGMALTNDAALAGRMELLRSHGITRDALLMVNPSDGPWYYEQLTLGFNYRMTDLQAALGASQMERLDSFIARRHEIAARYNAELSGLPLTTPWQHPDTHSAYHLYVIRLDVRRNSISHRAAFEALRARGIGVNLHYIPIYRQPDYASLDLKREDFPQAEAHYAEAISLPMYPAMTDAQQDEVVAAVRGVVAA